MAHTPGRGHRRKSDPAKKRRFQEAAARKRAEAEIRYDKALAIWSKMSEAARKLNPELDPEKVRPRWRSEP